MRRRFYVLAMTFAATIAAGACRDKAAPLPGVARPAELLGGATVNGRPMDLAALRGKVVVVNFWSPS